MRKQNGTVWSERYRPISLEECILTGLESKDRARIKALAVAPSIGRLLLYGSNGTGKTTIARILFAKPEFESDRLRIDDTRDGREILREIERTLSTVTRGPQRLIYVEEVDQLSKREQGHLAAAMNLHEDDSSWVMTCNDIGEVIMPLRSRLKYIHFRGLPRDRQESHLQEIVARCQAILEKERISRVSPAEIRAIAEEWYPDIRKIIDTLQSDFEYRVARLKSDA